MRQIVVACAMALVVAGTMVTQAFIATRVEAQLIPPRTWSKHRIVVVNWPCEEDEVLRGRGDFNGRRWDFYRCWNPGW